MAELELVLRALPGSWTSRSTPRFSEIAGRSAVRPVSPTASCAGSATGRGARDRTDRARAASAALDMYESRQARPGPAGPCRPRSLITKFGGGPVACPPWPHRRGRGDGNGGKQSPSRTSSVRDCWAHPRGGDCPRPGLERTRLRVPPESYAGPAAALPGRRRRPGPGRRAGPVRRSGMESVIVNSTAP